MASSCGHIKCKIAKEKNLEKIGFVAIKKEGEKFERVFQSDKEIPYCEFNNCIYYHFKELLIHFKQTHLTGANFYSYADAMLKLSVEDVKNNIFDNELRIAYQVDLFEKKSIKR